MAFPVLPMHRGLSGDIVVQFASVKPFNLGVLQALMASAPELPPGSDIEVDRVIESLSPASVAMLEAGHAPGRVPISLNALFRVRLRRFGLDVQTLEVIRVYLEAQRGVAKAYLELAVSLASQLWWELGFAPDQQHLLDAPDGIGARTYWGGAGCAGAGTQLYAVEHGWAIDHQDLKARGILGPLTGDNASSLPVKDAAALRRLNHGTSALATAVGCDDAPGRIGVAPAIAGVWVSSAYDAARDVGENVASAILAVVNHKHLNPQGAAVMMLQVQRGFGLPVEVDLADFLAIRLAVLRGLVVVQPAGNGGCDLSVPGWPDSGAIVVGALDPSTQLPVANSNFGARVDCFAQGRGVFTSGAPLDRNGLPDRSTGPISALRRDDFGRTSAATAIVAGVALCLLGRARALKLPNQGSLDTRAWLKSSAHGDGPPDLGAVTDAALARQGGKLGLLKVNQNAWPWRKGHPFSASSLTVSNPQTGEGNTNLKATTTTIGYVRLPPLAGTTVPLAIPGALPMGSGPTDPSWVEHWVLSSAAVLTDPPAMINLNYDAGNVTSNPYGQIWGPDVINYFKNHPSYNSDWRRIDFSFKYLPIPSAPQPPVTDAGWTLLHFELFRTGPGGPVKVGELRRRVQGNKIEDRWALYDNYRFAEPGADVQICRAPALLSQSTQDWHSAIYQASGGNPSPKPYWFVHTVGDLVPL